MKGKKSIADQELTRAIDWKIFEYQSQLLSPDCDEITLTESLSWCQPRHYDEIVEERNNENRCGYPTCGNLKKDAHTQEYKVDMANKKVFKVNRSIQFCGVDCIKKYEEMKKKKDDSLPYGREIVRTLKGMQRKSNETIDEFISLLNNPVPMNNHDLSLDDDSSHIEQSLDPTPKYSHPKIDPKGKIKDSATIKEEAVKSESTDSMSSKVFKNNGLIVEKENQSALPESSMMLKKERPLMKDDDDYNGFDEYEPPSMTSVSSMDTTQRNIRQLFEMNKNQSISKLKSFPNSSRSSKKQSESTVKLDGRTISFQLNPPTTASNEETNRDKKPTGRKELRSILKSRSMTAIASIIERKDHIQPELVDRTTSNESKGDDHPVPDEINLQNLDEDGEIPDEIVKQMNEMIRIAPQNAMKILSYPLFPPPLPATATTHPAVDFTVSRNTTTTANKTKSITPSDTATVRKSKGIWSNNDNPLWDSENWNEGDRLDGDSLDHQESLANDMNDLTDDPSDEIDSLDESSVPVHDASMFLSLWMALDDMFDRLRLNPSTAIVPSSSMPSFENDFQVTQQALQAVLQRGIHQAEEHSRIFSKLQLWNESLRQHHNELLIEYQKGKKQLLDAIHPSCKLIPNLNSIQWKVIGLLIIDAVVTHIMIDLNVEVSGQWSKMISDIIHSVCQLDVESKLKSYHRTTSHQKTVSSDDSKKLEIENIWIANQLRPDDLKVLRTFFKL